MSPVETMAELSHELARSGLVVADCFSDSELSIARPASAGGTAFRGRGGTSMVGIGNAMLQTDAPTCTVRRRQKSPSGWSTSAKRRSPGPGLCIFMKHSKPRARLARPSKIVTSESASTSTTHHSILGSAAKANGPGLAPAPPLTSHFSRLTAHGSRLPVQEPLDPIPLIVRVVVSQFP